MQSMVIFRRSHPVFLGKGVQKICSKFIGEHLCRSAISIRLLCNFIEIALRYGCSPVNLLHIFRTPFPRNTSGWLLLLSFRSTLSSIFLNDVGNSLSSFIARRSSSNLETRCYLYALEDPFEMSCLCLDSKNEEDSWPKVVWINTHWLQISCLKTMIPIVEKHFFMRKDIALTRDCLVKYLLPASLEVQ